MPIDKLISAGMKAYRAGKKSMEEPAIPSLSKIRPETARTAGVKSPSSAAPAARAASSSTKGKGDPNLLADQMGGLIGKAAKGLRGRGKY